MLEPREIKRLLSYPELTYEQRTVFSLAIYTGLREGELAALLRTDIIDLDGADPHLTVTKSWDDASTKTGKSRRVALISAAVKVLREWLAHTDGTVSKNLWGHIFARRGSGQRPHAQGVREGSQSLPRSESGFSNFALHFADFHADRSVFERHR